MAPARHHHLVAHHITKREHGVGLALRSSARDDQAGDRDMVHMLAAAVWVRRGRLARFAATGGTAAIAQICLLAFLQRAGWPALLANTVAFGLSTQLNFLLSQTVTWRDRWDGGHGLLGRWLRYHCTIAGSAVLNLAVFTVALGTLPSLGAAALGIGAASLANFVGSERFVFRPVATGPSTTPGPRRLVPCAAHASARQAPPPRRAA